MRARSLALLLLLAPLAPAALAAQAEPVSIPRLSLSAYTGMRMPFVTGHVTAFGPEGQVLLQSREERGGGPVLGLEAELGTGGPLRLMLGGLITSTGRGDFFFARDPGDGSPADAAIAYSGSTWFAKAGLSYRLLPSLALGEGRRRASTDFFIAPALVRELDANHPAVNFGFKGAFPFGERRGVEVNVGLEDYLVFWRHDELAEPMTAIFGDIAGAHSVDFLYDTSNRLVLRIGASIRR